MSAPPTAAFAPTVPKILPSAPPVPPPFPSTISPLFPLAPAPVLKLNKPEAAVVDPPAAVANLISPLDLTVEAPDVNSTDPPEALEVASPAVIVTPEAAPVLLVPTLRDIPPAAPPVAPPDESDNAPLTPADEAGNLT